MVAARFEIQKFTEESDFGLWNVTMKAFLLQQGLCEALEPKVESSKASKETKYVNPSKIEQKAHNTINLNLGDKTLSEVAKQKTTKTV